MEPFDTEKARVRRSFERAARSYDAAAVLQREVAQRMAARLDYIKQIPDRILDAGSGTGFGSKLLRERYPRATVLELDLALGMLQQARQPARGMARWLPFLTAAQPQVCADVERMPFAPAVFDLIWSNLAFQWCNQPDDAFRECHRALRVDGLFSFTTLGPDTLKELRTAFADVDQASHVNRFIDMHDLGDALVRAGFAEPMMDVEYITLTYDDVAGVMHDLKAIGAHNVTVGRPRGLMGKQAWRRVQDRYEAFRQNGRLPATYEVVYGHAWKAPLKNHPDGRAVVQFQRQKP